MQSWEVSLKADQVTICAPIAQAIARRNTENDKGDDLRGIFDVTWGRYWSRCLLVSMLLPLGQASRSGDNPATRSQINRVKLGVWLTGGTILERVAEKIRENTMNSIKLLIPLV
jgi:hypothetical protein